MPLFVARHLLGALCLLLPSASAASTEEPSAKDVYGFLADEMVVVSSSGVAQTINEAPSVISVITAKEMQRRGHRSLAEALATLPGFSFVDDHVLPNLAIRGVFGGLRGWGRLIKVLIDGQAIAFQQDNTNWLGAGLIPLSIIDHIEVIRGPGSTLYGANAFLGVVNVITVKAENAPRLSAQVGGLWVQGNPGAEAELLAGYQGGSWDALIAGNMRREDRSGLRLEKTFPLQEAPPAVGTETRNDVRTPRSLYARISYVHPVLGTFKSSTFWQQLKTAAEFQDFSVLTGNSTLSMYNGHVALSWRKGLGDLSMKAEGAYSTGGVLDDERLDVGTPDSLLRRRSSYKTISASADMTYSFLQQSTAKWGIDIQRGIHLQPVGEEILSVARGTDPKGTVIQTGPLIKESLQNIGYWAQVQMGPLKGMTVTGGVRWDQNSVYGDNISLRGALVVAAAKWLSLKALFGSSIMAPAPDQLFSQAALGEAGILGNPDLKAQTAMTAELAIEVQAESWLSLRVAAFQTDVSDKIEFQRWVVNLRPLNRDKLKTRGLELETRSRFGRFAQQLGIALVDTTREQTETRITPDPIDLLNTGVPSLQVTTGLEVAVPEAHVNFHLEGLYLSPRTAVKTNMIINDRSPYSLPAAIVVDLTISSLALDLWGGDSSHTTITAKLSNVFNQRYSAPSYARVDVPQLGRRLFVSLRQDF